MNNLSDFVKSAAEYSEHTGRTVNLAYGALMEIKATRDKCAALASKTVTALESLTRASNGQPFVPEGFRKQATAFLSSHEDTIKLLNAVLNEYGQLKAAVDRQTPPIGSAGKTTKTASSKKTYNFDSPESNAMRLFNERLLS